MRLVRLVPAIILVGTLAGGLPSTSLSPVPLLVAEGVTRQQPEPGAPVGTVADAVAALGYRMRTLAQDGNWVASPLSVAYAFAMLRAGAGPGTGAAIDRTFRFPAQGVDAAFNAITRQVATGPVPTSRPAGEPVVTIGNGLFVQQGLPVGKPYLRTLAREYGAGVSPVDFGSPDAARVIDNWVRRQTNGKIRHAYQPGPGNTVAVLTNTVYLHADWAQRFLGTQDEPFAGAGSVSTMFVQTELPYATGKGWTAVDLPYAKSDLVMRILIPSPGGDPTELLRPQAMATIAEALQPRRIELHLPKWTFRADADLAGLGPAVLYRPGADLSGIAPGLWVAKASHQAYIAVDETGTEAAAATTVMMATSGEVQPPPVVRVDHPFAFAIVHKPTGVPLFVGRVVNPSGP
jgi:serpin B